MHVSPLAPLPLRSPPPPLGVRLRRAALTAAGAGVFGALLSAGGVPCTFAQIFHVPCPGCGSTRSSLALIRGDLEGVLRFNPFGPIMAVLLGALAVQALASMLAHGDLRNVGEGRAGLVMKRGILAVAALEVFLWISRFFGVLGGPVPV